MIDDDLDRLVRAAIPPVEVDSERIDRLARAVFADLAAKPSRVADLVRWLSSPSLIGRYLLPMATAAVLGVVVGHHTLPAPQPADITVLMASSSTVFSGF